MKTSCCHSKKILQEKNCTVCMNVDCANYLQPTTKISSAKWNKIFFSFLFIFIFILTFNDFSTYPGNITANFVVKYTKDLNANNLRKELDLNSIICQEEVYAQIMIESGNLTSYLAIKTNNLLGMRYPFKRKTTAIGIYLPATKQIIQGTQAELKKYRKESNYAVYASWEECVKDYKLWQDKNFKLTEKYLAFLGSYYSEDSLYIAKINSITGRKN